jgi:hypothetical protein
LYKERKGVWCKHWVKERESIYSEKSQTPHPIMNPVAVADEYSTTKNESGMVKTCIGKHG